MLSLNLKPHTLFLVSALFILTFILTPKAHASLKIYIGDPSVDDCRKCHGDIDKQPHPLLKVNNINRHHDLVGKEIEGLYSGYYNSVAPGDTSKGIYECISCHQYNNETPIVVKDCIKCHPKLTLISQPGLLPDRPDHPFVKNIHHDTDAFERDDCNSCHRFLSKELWPKHEGMYIYENEPIEKECRRCHGDNSTQPHPALKESNANRHHNLVGNEIEGFYDGFYDSMAPGDKSSGIYTCLSCHIYENLTFVAPKDCMSCHIKRSVISRPRPDVKNVHHNTKTFHDNNCKNCHWF